MRVSPDDIAKLSDDDVKVIVLAVVHTVGNPPYGPLDEFWRSFAASLTRALRQRRQEFALLAADAMNDDGPGELVQPGDDPVGDAQAELRRIVRGEAVE